MTYARQGQGHSKVKILIAVVITTVLAAGCASTSGVGGGGETSRTLPPPGASESDLLDAARSEPQLTFYAAPVEEVADAIVKGFEEKYGITVTYVRLASSALLQRFSAEANSGNYQASLLLLGSDNGFVDDAVQKGWVQSISEPELPALQDGTFPDDFLRGKAAAAVVQVKPWAIAYNTDKLSGADVPTAWKDLADPRYRGEILIPDPGASDAYLPLWQTLLDEYGPTYFEGLRANQPKIYQSSLPAVQALGAGEGELALPTLPSTVTPIQSKGAPVKIVQPDLTVGVETNLALVAPDHASSPATARLLANYILSKEGNTEMSAGQAGTYSVYDTSGLPADYRAPSEKALANKDEILRLLGVQEN